jgi:hypothetical protein
MPTQKPAQQERKGSRGPAPGQGGRPPGPAKVKLTTWILPETRAALGDKPGQTLDTLMARLA